MTNKKFIVNISKLNKKFLTRYVTAVKRGLVIPTLTDNILKLQLHPVIRVLRVVGGLSTLLLITDRVRDYSLPIYVYIIAIVLSIVFLIYHIYRLLIIEFYICIKY